MSLIRELLDVIADKDLTNEAKLDVIAAIVDKHNTTTPRLFIGEVLVYAPDFEERDEIPAKSMEIIVGGDRPGTIEIISTDDTYETSEEEIGKVYIPHPTVSHVSFWRRPNPKLGNVDVNTPMLIWRTDNSVFSGTASEAYALMIRNELTAYAVVYNDMLPEDQPESVDD